MIKKDKYQGFALSVLNPLAASSAFSRADGYLPVAVYGPDVISGR
jgi:hypothetical protein